MSAAIERGEGSAFSPGILAQRNIQLSGDKLHPIEDMKRHLCWTLLGCWFLWSVAVLPAEQVQVRHREGVVHGFLILGTPEGETLADGDLIQVARGDQVTAKAIFHFKDGSVQEETTVYSQRHTFRLLSSRLVQKGPSFKNPVDISIDAKSGQVTVHYADDKGNAKAETTHVDLPPDLANGLLFTLLKNIQPGASGLKVSMLAATPKPRLVKLAIASLGEEPFTVAGSSRKATHYVVKFELGGLTGAIAPLLKKQPPDIHVWILPGEAPAFVKSEGPIYAGGPIWRIELACPVWTANAKESTAHGGGL